MSRSSSTTMMRVTRPRYGRQQANAPSTTVTSWQQIASNDGSLAPRGKASYCGVGLVAVAAGVALDAGMRTESIR